MSLLFFRCRVCLNVCAISAQAYSLGDKIECLCGGVLSFMGRTHRDPKVLVDSTLVTPCSTLCTDAAGPCCNCACGGAHHGTGRMVEIIREVGRAPRVGSVDQRALDRASEFLALVDAFEPMMLSRFGAVYTAFLGGSFIDRSTWLEIIKTRRKWADAKALLVHRKRIDRMREVLGLEAKTWTAIKPNKRKPAAAA